MKADTKQIVFMAVKTAFVLPWALLIIPIGIACTPIAIAMSLVLAEDFSDFIGLLIDFYSEHLMAVSGLSMLAEGWAKALSQD